MEKIRSIRENQGLKPISLGVSESIVTSNRIDPPPRPPNDEESSVDRRPFADSLCHRCAAPPQYIHTERSTFIRCPILKRYPPQPVLACEAFKPIETGEP
jgi:hypothetical protein